MYIVLMLKSLREMKVKFKSDTFCRLLTSKTYFTNFNGTVLSPFQQKIILQIVLREVE